MAKKIKRDQEQIKKDSQDLYRRMNEINDKRRKRVLKLLKLEGRAICLLHLLIFQESPIDKCLVPKDSVKIVRMYRSWTISHRCYDSDTTYTDHSDSYDTSACTLCRNVASRANFNDKNYRKNTMGDGEPKTESIEELYSAKIIDRVSLEYYQMPPVSNESLFAL